MRTAMKAAVAAASAVLVGGMVIAMLPAAAQVTGQESWDATRTCTADSQGYCTVGHPAGVVPDAVVVTPSTPMMVGVDQLTATTFRVRFARAVSAGGNVTPVPGAKTFFVHAGWTPGAPSTTAPATASPSPSVSSSPSPSPSVSPTLSPGWPDATNTGVPAGTALTVVNGNMTISTAGAVVDAKDIRGCVNVTAPGVTISRSKVTCPGGLAVTRSDTGGQSTPLTVVDSEVSCGNGGGTGIGEANIVVLRVDITDCENGLDVNQFVTVRDSYIHDLTNTADSHTDGIQFAHYLNGCTTTACEVGHARNVTIEHNTIYGTGDQGPGTSAVITNPAGDENVLIKGNLLAGGAFTLYCNRPGAGTNFEVSDNHFSRVFHPAVGFFGPQDDCEDEAGTGNVYDDTGAAVW